MDVYKNNAFEYYTISPRPCEMVTTRSIPGKIIPGYDTEGWKQYSSATREREDEELETCSKLAARTEAAFQGAGNEHVGEGKAIRGHGACSH